jgi:phosphatidylglycerophosphatase A
MNPKRVLATVLLWIAQGFGVGRVPLAPGTLGSAVGLLWFFILLATANLWAYVACAFGLLAFAVWSCGAAEKILGQTDPSSVVLDEIAAVPFCFVTWLAHCLSGLRRFPGIEDFLPDNWTGVLALLIVFRIFDIWKPWPIRQSQALPGGWGVTVDDFLAALYVNGVFEVCYQLKFLFHRV